jgi:hypothetical protein
MAPKFLTESKNSPAKPVFGISKKKIMPMSSASYGDDVEKLSQWF